MDKRVEEILITKWQIDEGLKKAAKWIDETYKDSKKDLILVGLLRGCVPFYGQLLSLIKTDVITDFMLVSSFDGEDVRISEPKIIVDVQLSITDKNVLLVEDIIDSAKTITYVIQHLKQKNPHSIKVISFLDKKAGRQCEFKLDYYCYDIEDKFLVGYGLDYKEKLRNLPYVGVFKSNKKEEKNNE